MSKKFTEYSHFDLSEVNKEVLKNGMKKMYSTRVWKFVKVARLSYFMKDRLLQTECRVFIT